MEKPWIRLLLSTLKQEGCSKSAACVLAVLADRATEHQTRACYMRQKELAELSGVEVRTVRRALKQLERLGLLHIVRERGEVCLYHLTDAVELSAKKRAGAAQSAAERARERKKREAEEEAAYMACVNRFRTEDE